MFHRFFDEGLAQASYLIACDRTRQAVVIDPRRDVDVYLAAARQQDLDIVATIDTHIHADYVSGARELAATGVRAMSGPGAGLAFACHEVADRERFHLGDHTLEFLHTPGHTPEHISILAAGPGEPVRVFTGDTLFVGAVGRPDLLGADQAKWLAGGLYDSLFQKLMALDPAVEVHPGHGAGSLCGSGISAEAHSTIGRERQLNPMLQHTSRESFVAAVLADLPETPPYFQRMKRINHDGPALRGLAQGYPGAAPVDVARAVSAVHDGAILIDIRDPDSFCALHPSGALNIAYGAKIGYWAGWVLPADARIVLIAPGAREAAEAGRQLLRVGFDRVEGYVDGGLEAWRLAGLPTSHIARISAKDLQERITRRDDVTIIDVRTAGEWARGHIEGAVNVPVGELGRRIPSLSLNAMVATICEGGFRSTLAASLIARARAASVVNVSGGMTAFRLLGGGTGGESFRLSPG